MIPQGLKEHLVRTSMPEGWCTPEKAEAMADLILRVRPAVSVELGVFGGKSLVAQAVSLCYGGIDGVVWGIDPWTVPAALEGEVGDANKEWWKSINIQAIRDQCLTGITERELWPWVRVIVAKSQDCHQLFQKIDVLHIDGNHSEECSVRDVLQWMPHVPPGGHIWFDDVEWNTTKKAVRILESECDQILEVTGCRLYRVRQ